MHAEIAVTPRFADLRPGQPWIPRFRYAATLDECADGINRPHEDYPRRVPATADAIRSIVPRQLKSVTTELILEVHNTVFHDAPFAGRLRQIPVRIADFVPPHSNLLPRLLRNLELAYADQPMTTDALASWYADFETVHPFQDGNGRTGGIIIAALNRRNDSNRWLTPGQ